MSNAIKFSADNALAHKKKERINRSFFLCPGMKLLYLNAYVLKA